MPFGLTPDPMGAVLIFVGGMAVVLGVRYLVAFVATDDDELDDRARLAYDETTQWAATALGALAGAAAIGLVQASEMLAMTFQFVGSHPYFSANFGVAGLGAAVISGFLSLTAQQYLGIAAVFVGGVMVAAEGEDDD